MRADPSTDPPGTGEPVPLQRPKAALIRIPRLPSFPTAPSTSSGPTRPPPPNTSSCTTLPTTAPGSPTHTLRFHWRIQHLSTTLFLRPPLGKMALSGLHGSGTIRPPVEPAQL